MKSDSGACAPVTAHKVGDNVLPGYDDRIQQIINLGDVVEYRSQRKPFWSSFAKSQNIRHIRFKYHVIYISGIWHFHQYVAANINLWIYQQQEAKGQLRDCKFVASNKYIMFYLQKVDKEFTA